MRGCSILGIAVAVFFMIGACAADSPSAEPRANTEKPQPAAQQATDDPQVLHNRPRRLYSPRVLSPHVADAFSIKTFRNFHRWKNLEGDELAWEVYKYLVDTGTGLFHMNEVHEGRDVLSEFRNVRDPVKIINVYGYGFCGILGPVAAGICQEMELGPARTLVLPDWGHVACETFYDGRWHYLDLDVRAVFRREDGTLASMADARRDASLWKEPGPLFFPNDPREVQDIYRRTPVHHYHGFHQSGHTLSYVLRPGETFTRWWHPQDGRWHHADLYHEVEWLRKLIESPPRGPKPNHRHFTVHNHGNGRFDYEPNLTSATTDFADGVHDARNVRTTAEGVTLAEPGEGFAVFRVRSPYIIVPRVGKMETRADDREASVVELDGSGLALSISLDGGLSWQPVVVEDEAVEGESAAVDLTSHVSGHYGYLFKIQLTGKPGESVLRSLKITTWVQVAPASLPALRQGTNRMQYVDGDHYGLPTAVAEVRSHARHPEHLLKYVLEPPADYDPERATAKIAGSVTVPVKALPGMKIAWFTAQGSFRTHFHEEAAKTANAIDYAVGEPREFRPLYRADVPTDTEHWHYNAAREVRLEEPAEAIFVRYRGDPALNNFHIHAHCIDDVSPQRPVLEVAHHWREGERERRFSTRLAEPAAYEVVCEGEPENLSVVLSVPSTAR